MIPWTKELDKEVSRVDLQIEGKTAKVLEVLPARPEIGYVDRGAVETPAKAPTSRAVHLSWQAKSAARLTHQVYFSNDGGRKWRLVATGLTRADASITVGTLPGGEKCLFQVRSSDGYHVTVKASTPFAFQTSPPEVEILTPRNDATVTEGEPVLLVGRGFDYAKGRRLPSESLIWSSDMQKELGRGERLVIHDLRPGEHKITLRAAGAEAMLTVKVNRAEKEKK